MGKDVIIACDFSSSEETLRFLDKLGEKRPYVKIGMELFYAEGPDIVKILKMRGHKVFLDLKLHDIPNTVRKSMSVLAGLGVDMCNVHAAGTIHDESGDRGAQLGRRRASAADSCHTTDFHDRGKDAARSADRQGDGAGGGSLCG